MPPERPAVIYMDMSALDGLRGVASLHILVYHFLRFTWIAEDPVEGAMPNIDVYAGEPNGGRRRGTLVPSELDLMGELVVLQFYFISGFALSTSYRFGGPREPAAGPAMDIVGFFAKRLARIMPLYYFTNVVGMVVATTDPFWLVSSDRALLFTPFHQFPVHVLVYLGLGSLLPDLMPPNAPSWTISVFLVCYLAFPPVAMRMPRVAPSRAHVGTRACLALYAILVFIVSSTGAGFGAAYNWSPVQLPLFFAGAFAALERQHELSVLRHPGPSLPEAKTQGWSAGVAAAMYALLYSLLVVVNAGWVRGSQRREALKKLGLVLVAPLAARLVCSLVVARRSAKDGEDAEDAHATALKPPTSAATERLESDVVTRVLSSRPLKYLGDLSLAVYLLQMPVARAVRWVADLPLLHGANPSAAAGQDRLRLPQLAGADGLHSALARCLVATLVTLCTSHATHHLVERPAAVAILDTHARLRRRMRSGATLLV